MRSIILISLAAIQLLLCSYNPAPGGKAIRLVIASAPNIRVKFGADKLTAVLQDKGYQVTLMYQNELPTGSNNIIIGTASDTLCKNAITYYNVTAGKAGKEGFMIASLKYDNLLISGTDPSGTLYGCLELAERLSADGKLPGKIMLIDQPEMVLRGSCIGVQKPVYLPGRGVYEYPYTPETFPWLYDKQLWIIYLDSMVANRMNSLYLWNGHPFASLVKLKEYPYAVEVSENDFKKNEDMYRFLTQEADKRGIWVIQMFYNIIVSKPFAEKNNIKTQDRNRPIIPLIADYTRKSIAAFVEKYPNVGLMVALGEAMEGVGDDDVEWFTKTIIPGVKDGLKALGKTEEPPIVLRAHDTDAPAVMKAALPLYKNLYTEAKYNGEALTTYTPRGPWAELHRQLSRIGTVQIENIHILANLEPFRYGSADFIQKCVRAMHDVHEGNGLHLYPESSYWDWPFSADKASPRLLQVHRDWIWYKAWSRYAWNCHRESGDEKNYWAKLLASVYGADAKGGNDIREAYQQSGEIAPKLLRRFGITDGNRQTLTLGMFMSQLVNPYRYGLFTLLYNSEGPEGEMLTEYAEKDWKGMKHTGETPLQVIGEVTSHAQKAVAAIHRASLSVTSNHEEFKRIENDMLCYQALAGFYAEKAKAALSVLRYKYSGDIMDLKNALPLLQNSVVNFRKLAVLTEDTYLYANSMQTQQRKIPIGGNDGTNKTWTELLPFYDQELKNFMKNLDSLQSPAKATAFNKRTSFANAAVTVLTATPGYSVNAGKEIFTDTSAYIKDFADELQALEGLRLSRKQQIAEGTTIQFRNAKPVKVLVGFFTGKSAAYSPAPQLEIDASANDFGQAEPMISNALVITGMPPVNIHGYSFKAGTNTLTLAKGACLIVGFIDDDIKVPGYDAGLSAAGVKKELDWLFE